MLRVVLDANIFVSAAISIGPSHRILQAALANAGVQALLCPALIAEVESVLSRPRLRRRISAENARVFVDDMTMLLDLVPDPLAAPAVTRDPNDDYLVALAREHGADWIVTGDNDLLEWEDQTPPAITPAAFEALLGDPPDN
ncbi:MAG: putative toxin-antitoxin system toxin component, PIN family [Rhodococcus sp. (in: high G+C Gram-positive bacteria)]